MSDTVVKLRERLVLAEEAPRSYNGPNKAGIYQANNQLANVRGTLAGLDNPPRRKSARLTEAELIRAVWLTEEAYMLITGHWPK